MLWGVGYILRINWQRGNCTSESCFFFDNRVNNDSDWELSPYVWQFSSSWNSSVEFMYAFHSLAKLEGSESFATLHLTPKTFPARFGHSHWHQGCLLYLQSWTTTVWMSAWRLFSHNVERQHLAQVIRILSHGLFGWYEYLQKCDVNVPGQGNFKAIDKLIKNDEEVN